MKPVRVRPYRRRREQPSIYTPFTAGEARYSGLRAESETKAWLRRTFPNEQFREPTRAEDEQQDIDIWRNEIPYSIKTQAKALETGNLSFELRKMDRNGQWHDSWFYKGKAAYYLVRFGRRVGVIYKDALIRHIAGYGWDRTIRNSPGIVQRERESRSPFIDAESGLVSLRNLEAAGLIEYLPNDLPAAT
jgi:hypothetical protein